MTLPIRNEVDRHKFPRNRKVSFTPAHVITDGKGGIYDRPLVRNPELPCFGKPEEYWRGISDRPWMRKHADGKVTEEAWGCAGCRVRAACGKVAYERKDSSPTLGTLHDAWESATNRLPANERYKVKAWLDFEHACRKHTWIDSHDRALEQDKEKRAAKERNRRKGGRRTRRQRRPITAEQVRKICDERDVRAKALHRLRHERQSPRWIAQRTETECNRVADVWKFRELLRAQRMKATGKAIASLMIEAKCGGNASLQSLTTRVLEISRRLDELEGTDDSDVMRPWRPFTLAGTQRAPAKGMIWVALDDDVEDG